MGKNYAPDYFYHIAEPANLVSIRRHGLLCTARLMQQAGMAEAEMKEALGRHRPEQLVLTNGVIIRDQSPMPPRSLAPVLSAGMEPSDWYRFLNGFVFLWADRERVDRHLGAFGKRKQALLVFDAARLLEEKGDGIFLSPINSGNAMRRAARRSLELFVPYKTWLETGWPAIDGRTRSKSAAPAEIVIKDGLPLKPYLVRVEET